MPFPDDLIAMAFGSDLTVTRKPLDGVKKIQYSRVDRDFQRESDGDKVLAAQLLIEIWYQPPGNKSALALYEGCDDFLVIERQVPAGAGTKAIYVARIKRCIHRRIESGGTYQDEYEVMLRVEETQ